MSIEASTRPGAATTTYLPDELVDPGWVQRRDEAVGLISGCVLLGVGCGLLITWLGWPAGPLAAAGPSLACARWFWQWSGGGSA